MDRRPSLGVVPAGRMAYEEALELQRGLARAKIRGELEDDLLLLVEHEPVLTLGRGAEESHVAAAPEVLESRGIRRVEVERGGDVTYHGPGQLVGYPILDLRRHRRDLHWYVRTLEGALIAALDAFGLPSFRVAGHTGVWVGRGHGDAVPSGVAGPLIAAGRVRKVASIGVHVSRWVTWHGFALNVSDEPLVDFRLIVPCGIEGVCMTSLAAEGVRTDVEDRALREAVGAGFAAAFGVRTVPGPGPEALAALARPLPVRESEPTRASAGDPDGGRRARGQVARAERMA